MQLCNFKVGVDSPFFVMAGPCVIESESLCLDIAQYMKEVCEALGIHYIFKASFDKANRTSATSFRGPGIDQGLKILDTVKSKTGLPVLTDVHTDEQVNIVKDVVDVLQTPAFLCRQTDFIRACAQSGKPVNIKKGQFLSPSAMQFAAQKVADAGNNNIMLTERGTTFGYTDLVVDFRGIPQMQQFGYPVIMDTTHSLQQPNQNSGVTGGMPNLIETIAKAAIAVGADGLFLETHPNPSQAKSDGANMLQLDLLEGLLTRLIRIRKAIQPA